jgi:hypothetical protein
MFAFLRLIPIRFYIYAAIAAAFAFVLMREKWAVDKAKRLSAENTQLSIQLKTANETLKRQAEASNAYHDEIERLQAARADTPTRSVRLCRPSPSMPAAASGTDSGGSEGLPDTAGSDPQPGPEIGVELYALADEADRCAAQRDALIRWVSR